MRVAPPKTNMGPENIPVRPKRKDNLVVPKPGKPGRGGISPVKPGKPGKGGVSPKPVKPGAPVLYGGGPKKTMMAGGGEVKKQNFAANAANNMKKQNFAAGAGDNIKKQLFAANAGTGNTGPKKTVNKPVGSGTVGGGGKPMKPGKFPATLVGLGASLLGGKGGKKPMMAKGGMTKKGKK